MREGNIPRELFIIFHCFLLASLRGGYTFPPVVILILLLLRSKANVPVDVAVKLVLFTILMIFLPIYTYYAGEALSTGL